MRNAIFIGLQKILVYIEIFRKDQKVLAINTPFRLVFMKLKAFFKLIFFSLGYVWFTENTKKRKKNGK